jgi:hypothetical protein
MSSKRFLPLIFSVSVLSLLTGFSSDDGNSGVNQIKHNHNHTHVYSHKWHKINSNRVMNFNRIATFSSCLQINTSCNTSDETAAEIVAASTDGMTLIYTDSPKNQT